MRKIGFTGSSTHTTHEQREVLRGILVKCAGDELHHGDCIEADAHAHDIAEACDVEPVLHPPTNPKKRAFKKAKRIYPERPYLDRNRDIVDCTQSLIAMPDSFLEQPRGGTWYTIRYARSLKRPICIIWPNGQVTIENKPHGKKA